MMVPTRTLRIAAALLLLTGSALAARAEVRTEEVSYRSGDVVLRGYLAVPDDATGPRPGILVVHEWWGHNEYARQRARMLAALGYPALAVDMYGEGKNTDHPATAGEFAGVVRANPALAEARFLAAKQLLQSHPAVQGGPIGAIGYCFGGAIVLNMARRGMDLAAVVSFHGSLATSQPAAPGQVKAKILVCHGGADSFIPDDQIRAFHEEMDRAGATYRFVVYDGARHSFTNPAADELAKTHGLGVGYHAAADAKSWADMRAFFADVFTAE